MSGSGIAWVLLSAVAHATWNFLFKRAGGTSAFMGLSKISEIVLITPLFLWFSLPLHVAWSIYLWLCVGSAAISLTVYILLSAAYAQGDLVFVYPVARGSILFFLPLLGALFLGEHIDRVGTAALLCLTLGVLMMPLPDLTWAATRDLVRHLTTRASVLALVYGFVTAGSVLWDKNAVQQLPRLTYYYGYNFFIAVGYAAYFAVSLRTPEATHVLRETWQRHRPSIIIVGLCNILSYMLILVALKNTTSSYVIGLRQLSIGISAFLGYYFLKEPLPRSRIAGVVFILVGCVLIPLAR